MSEGRISIYRTNGALIGYFRNPQVHEFSQGEYEIKGMFYGADGSLPTKLEFNPQVSPYWATLESMPNVKHQQLTNIYVQRGRQPVTISALGINT